MGVQTHVGFTTTQWSLIDQLHSEKTEIRRGAMNCLAESYWPPVYAWLRRSNKNQDEAAEITQGFFADVICGRGLFDKADSERGRLRTLILASLKRYLVDRHRRETVRGAGRTISFDKIQNTGERNLVDAQCSPDELFDRRWALATMERAIDRCREHFDSTGKHAHWELFDRRVLRSNIYTVEPEPLAALVEELQFESNASASAAIQVVKRRLQAIIQEVVAETAHSPEDQEDEYRRFLRILG